MKVLPMDQPWASLVVHGKKVVETRPRPHPSVLFGTRIAIHANKKTDHIYLLETEPFKSALSGHPVPLGYIIGTVEIVRSIGIVEETVGRLKVNKPDEIPFGDYTYGRFAWLLKDPVALKEPVPFRAHQGWPDVSIDLIPEYAQ